MGLLIAAAPWLEGRLLPLPGGQGALALTAVAAGSLALAYSGFPRKMLVRDGDQGWKLRLLALCVGLELALLALLAGRFAAIGAAGAFAFPAMVAAALLTWRAMRRLRTGQAK